MATKKRPVTKSGLPRKRKGVKLEPTQLGPKDLRLDPSAPEVAELVRQVEEDGGAVLAAYREPLGGSLAGIGCDIVLPILTVEGA